MATTKKTATTEAKKNTTTKPKTSTKTRQPAKATDQSAAKETPKLTVTKPAAKKAEDKDKTATPKKAVAKTTKPGTAKKEAVAVQIDTTIKSEITSVEKPTEAGKKQTVTARKTASRAAKAAPKDKWHEIRQSLLEIKATTLSEINKVVKIGSVNQGIEETTGDIYDQASSERDRELGLLLNDRERDKLYNIDEALLKMSDGDYGICEECEEDIPFGRLKVLPFTRHCVKCKAELEKFQAQTRRIDDDRVYREIPVSDDDDS